MLQQHRDGLYRNILYRIALIKSKLVFVQRTPL